MSEKDLDDVSNIITKHTDFPLLGEPLLTRLEAVARDWMDGQRLEVSDLHMRQPFLLSLVLPGLSEYHNPRDTEKGLGSKMVPPPFGHSARERLPVCLPGFARAS
jgi:hypothetical protein